MSQSSLSENEKSEIENLKEDLINSITEFHSLPTSPLSNKSSVELFKLETRSAPPSPIFRRENLLRPNSIQNLISVFEDKQLGSQVLQTPQPAKMAEINSIKGGEPSSFFLGKKIPSLYMTNNHQWIPELLKLF